MFPSHFTSRPGSGQDPGLPTFGIEYRHPLWAGAGTEFTRIAGPINSRTTIQNVPAVNQGVVIARIRTDISLADFEAAVLNLIRDVENVYWDLYLAYRTYDAEVVARNSALQTWREVKSKLDQGLPGGSAADEAQARDNYFETRARAEQALSNIYTTETRLRRLLGLPVNDGRIIRPATEPVTAEFNPDWRTCLVEALTRRVELRRQKWNIKSLELQLKAARSLTYPRLDFVSRYQINGFGDKLFGSNSPAEPYKSAYDRLFHGDETGWGLGFEFSLPIGFRAAHAQVRNVELRLAKARAALAAQELEISHELAAALQQLDQAYVTAQTNFNRMRAAQRRVQAFEAEYKTGRTTLDLLLRAQISLAQAEIAYFSSLVQYNQALNELRFRKGTLLEDDNIYLAESLSEPQAYVQALRRAWARSYAIDAPHLVTQPEEFASDVPYEIDLSVTPRSESAAPDPTAPEAPSPQEKPGAGQHQEKHKPVPKPQDVVPPAPAPLEKKPTGVQAKAAPRADDRTSSLTNTPSSAPFPVAKKAADSDPERAKRPIPSPARPPIPDARLESPSVKRR